MQIVRLDPLSTTPDDILAATRGAAVAIGNFDGLHRGHQALFAAVGALARQIGGGARPGVITFSPHPVKVLAPRLAPPLILRPDEKIAGLEAAGIELVVELAFTPALAALPAATFCAQVLVERLGVAGVVVGEGFKFGAGALGRFADLQTAFGDRAVAVPSVREGSYVCSSSKIRELVLLGHVDAAGTLLGRPYQLEGRVVRGDGRGRTIQIPTANLETGRELLPRVGVYATRARLADGRVVPSVTNVGLRPTFQGEGVRVEAHLFDVDLDLYDQRLRLDFVKRLRDEQRFGGIAALVEQIHADIAAARAVLA